MSIRTEFEKIMLHVPNVFTGTLHAGFYTLAMIASVFPGGTKAYTWLRDQGHQYTLDSAERANYQRENIKRLMEMDKQAAIADKEIANAVAPLIQEEADNLRQKRMVELKGKSDLRILSAKERGELELLAAEEQQRIMKVQQGTKYAAKEKETAFTTEMFSLSQSHLEKMTNLKGQLRNISDSLEETTKQNKSVTEASAQSVMKLNTAMGLLVQANMALQNALNTYDSTVAEGEADSDKEQAISEALITAMQAEKKMETVLETAQISNKSELKKAFMQDVAKKNQQLDKLLYTYSKQTLTKLSELIQKQIAEIQVKSAAYTESSDIENCKKNLEALTTMLAQVEQITLEKEEPVTKITLKR